MLDSAAPRNPARLIGRGKRGKRGAGAGVSAGVLDGVPVQMPVPVRVVRIIHGSAPFHLESAGLNLNEGLTEFAPKVKASALGISRKELGLKKGLSRFDDMKVTPSVLLGKGGELADCAIGMLLTVMIKQQEEREA